MELGLVSVKKTAWFVTHTRETPYKMSCGVIVKKTLLEKDVVSFIPIFNFMGIEPFTLILAAWLKNLKTCEFVWDGTLTHFKELPQEPKICSSSILYTEAMRALRKGWFVDWLFDKHQLSQKKIVEFHRNKNLGIKETSAKMKRAFAETVRITSLKKKIKSEQWCMNT